jgi:hypothetical protein
MSTVLLATSTWWPAPARLAMVLRRLGFRVEAICPRGHPLRHTSAVARCIRYPFVRPLAGLRDAIGAAEPAFIVPCDDRAVHHLHRLHDVDPCGRLAGTIADSLGASTNFGLLESRQDLLDAAIAEGIRVPHSMRLRCEADLDLWREPFPWVIKRSMSWGGAGVRIVQSRAEAVHAFRTLARPISLGRALKRLVVNGDGYWLAPSLARSVPELTVQRFIAGKPASTTMACKDGEVLAQIGVRALGTQGPTGASTVVRVIDRPDMAESACRLAARLHLSGLHGLDFILDAQDNAWLIELNPRATQTCHLSIDGGVSLAEALAVAYSGAHLRDVRATPVGTTVAFFPQAWRSDPRNPLLQSATHDVPWEEPDLVEALMAPPWPNQGLLARAWQRLFDANAGRDSWAGAVPVAQADIVHRPMAMEQFDRISDRASRLCEMQDSGRA